MTESDFSPVINTLNSCVAQFYVADEYDLAQLGSILAKLDELHEEYPISETFQEKLGEFVSDIETAMLSDSIRPILERGPSMISSLISLVPDAEIFLEKLQELPELNEGQQLFATENIGVELEKLDSLEDLVLSVEQNDSEEKWRSIQSILHSLKGDFGVLGLRSLVKLVHDVEDALLSSVPEEKGTHVPMLFAFRDLVVGRVKEIQRGVFIPLSEEELGGVFRRSEELSCETKTPPMSTTLVVDAEVDLLTEFITESKEHMAAAESALMELENAPNNRELVDAAFRACHTVKGVAGFLNLKPLQELAHALESVMDAGRMGKIAFDSAILTLLLDGFDFLSELVLQVESLLPSGKALVNPELFAVYCRLNETHATIAKQDEILQKTKKFTVVESPKAPEVSMVQEDRIAPVTRSDNQIPIEKNVSPVSDLRTMPVPTQPNQGENSRNSAESVHGKVDETVRVSVQRLDRLIDSIGEIVIAQSMLTADPDFVRMKSRSVEQKASQISLVMRQIQEEAMSLRMISLKSTFQKMSRLVRDLSNKMDKPVELIVTGEDTELDKSIIEHIGDPLVHMLRNSVDHGIESPQERLDAGKEPIGTVELRAYHKSGNVVIDIVDDGRGLNKQKLLHKAISNGIASANRDYSEQEIYQFIFAPGFSTAAEVTDISGRGVGMDVVKRNILGMRGSLEIHSDEGKGTCFSVKLPLTMAIIDGMIVYAGGETLIVPTLSIVSTVNPKPGQIQSVRGKGEMLNLHNQLYRFVRLSDLLGMECERKNPSDGIAIILENILGNRIALWVDGILKKQQVVIKSLGRLFRNYKWISGGAVLGDGKINLILDVNELFQMVEK